MVIQNPEVGVPIEVKLTLLVIASRRSTDSAGRYKSQPRTLILQAVVVLTLRHVPGVPAAVQT